MSQEEQVRNSMSSVSITYSRSNPPPSSLNLILHSLEEELCGKQH